MSEHAKDSAKPKMRPLWRKLGVVAGLALFAVVVMVSIELSNPGPSFLSVHDDLRDHIRTGRYSIRLPHVVEAIGLPSKTLTLTNGSVKRGEHHWIVPRVHKWNRFDARSVTTIEVWVDPNDVIVGVSCYRKSLLEYIYDNKIAPWSKWIGW